MENLSTVQAAILIIAIVLLAIKTLYFFKYINRKKFKYWVYFDRLNIMNSRNEESMKAKKLQNLLTVLFTMLVAVVLVLYKLK